MNKLLLVSVISFLIPSSFVLAHPGRTDSSGCHTCKTNCPKWGLSYGEYHCHQSKGASQPVEPIHSVYSNTGYGTTIPAPEYKEVKKVVPVTVSVPKKQTQPTVTTTKVNKNADIPQLVVTPQVKEETKGWLSQLFNWFK